MARKPRITEENGIYHVISRVVGREHRLAGSVEKDEFVKIMRNMEAFSGVEVLTYTVLCNHFHILFRIPPRQEISDDEALHARMKHIYAESTFNTFVARQKKLRKLGATAIDVADEERQKVLNRMYSLKDFMKTLKQLFTLKHNKRHNRKGTLWEGRYKSLVVEGEGDPLLKVAAYIDLNAVRAGIVDDPANYRWCGYGASIRGVKAAKRGQGWILDAYSGESGSNKQAAAGDRYRLLLYGEGEELSFDAETGDTLRKGFTQEEVAAVYAAGGKLTDAQLLRMRVRFFTEGVMIGGRAKLDAFFDHNPEFFGPRRKSGPRPTPFVGLFSLRKLKSPLFS